MALFAPRRTMDEAGAAKRLRTIDPTVNLAAQQSDALGDGFGIARDGGKENRPPPPAHDADDMDDASAGGGAAQSSIIHDINRYGSAVCVTSGLVSVSECASMRLLIDELALPFHDSLEHHRMALRGDVM